MAGNGASTVVLIPGIGGHPRFHDGFVAALGERYRVHTAPHVDFFDDPCPDWNGHVEHWLALFRDATAGPNAASDATPDATPGPPPDPAPPAIVGVSFGAHVAEELRRRLPDAALGGVVLISYWPLTRCQRRFLRVLRRLPLAGAFAVGTVCFRWSERQASDIDRLRRLRCELYDDERMARRRLWARLASLADAPPAPTGGGQAAFVYARRELPLRAMRRRLGGRLPARTVVVDGDHSVSLDGSAELASAVARLIGQPAIRGDR